MSVVSGQFHLGETRAASWLLARRLLGWRRFAIFIFPAPMFLAMLAMTAAVEAIIPAGTVRSILFPVSIGLVGVLSFLLFIRWQRRSMVRAWERRGVQNPLLASWTIDEAGVEVATPSATTRLAWDGVSEVCPTKVHWVFISNGLGYCLPRRFFSDANAERALIAEALSHMTAEARGRSASAVKFVEF